MIWFHVEGVDSFNPKDDLREKNIIKLLQSESYLVCEFSSLAFPHSISDTQWAEGVQETVEWPRYCLTLY